MELEDFDEMDTEDLELLLATLDDEDRKSVV